MGCQSLVKFQEKIDWTRSRKKKTTAVIFSFERCHWISVGPSWLVPRWFNGNAQNWKLRPWVFFYGSLFLLEEPKFHSFFTLSSNNSRSKADTPNKFHIFGIIRMFSFTWFYPGYFFLWANFEESVFYGKRAFLAFFHDHTCLLYTSPSPRD